MDPKPPFEPNEVPEEKTPQENPVVPPAQENPVVQPQVEPQMQPQTQQPPSMWGQPRLELQKIADAVNQVKSEIRKIIVGQDEMVDLLLVSIFTGGHVLLEGVPGIAKTLSAKMLAKTLSVDFSGSNSRRT